MRPARPPPPGEAPRPEPLFDLFFFVADFEFPDLRPPPVTRSPASTRSSPSSRLRPPSNEGSILCGDLRFPAMPRWGAPDERFGIAKPASPPPRRFTQCD